MYLLLWDEPISGTQYETLENEDKVVDRLKELEEIHRNSLYCNKVSNIQIFVCYKVQYFSHLIDKIGKKE